MRILCIAPYVPHARIPHAGGAYLYAYLRQLAETDDVELIAPDDADNAAALSHVDVGIRVTLVPPAKPRLGFAETKARNYALALSPGWPALQGLRSSPLVQERMRWCDLVDVEYGYLLPLVPQLRGANPAARVVCTEHDVTAQVYDRFSATARGPLRIAYRVQSRRIARREAALLNQCDLVRVTNRKDERLLRLLGVHTPCVVTNAAPAPRPDLHDLPADGPVVFTGALWRRENARSVHWFVAEVWPIVRRQVPTARFLAVGADPASDLLRLSDVAGVEIRGWVPDLGAIYRQAAVFVAPLRMGAGVKIKVLDAMSHGLPVVATGIGAEGIVDEAPSGALAAVTDDPERFATAVVELLRDPASRQSIGRQAREWIAGLPTFEESVAESREAYAALVGKANA